jgi:diguanylate cyclase (GGDEF)-like protein
MQGAEFLAWFFEKRWRRFNKANVLRGKYRPWEIKSIFGRYPLLVPIRHREGLWGVMVLARTKRGQGFSGEERARAEVFGMHLARTFYILEHYQESNERAFVDQITGLYNQRFFDFYGQHEFFIASQSHAPLSVLAVNVLSFREVNERYGHLAGADLLGQIGKILKRAFRESDIIIRLDGDIFVSLLRNTNLVTAKVVEKRIHQLLADSQLKIKAGITLQPKLTTSIVVFPDDGSDLKNILQLGLDRLNSR